MTLEQNNLWGGEKSSLLCGGIQENVPICIVKRLHKQTGKQAKTNSHCCLSNMLNI